MYCDVGMNVLRVCSGSAAMDRYGYVSNNYHGQAMAGQARATAGNGGCSCSSHHHHGTKHMPASQPMCTCNKKGPKKAPVVISQPPVMTQPGYEEAMIFSLEGRDWTTGICGCFEHCSSCTCSTLSFFIVCLSITRLLGGHVRHVSKSRAPSIGPINSVEFLKRLRERKKGKGAYSSS